jgi:hypothetical protein
MCFVFKNNHVPLIYGVEVMRQEGNSVGNIGKETGLLAVQWE